MTDHLKAVAQKQNVPLEILEEILAIEKECLDLDVRTKEPLERIERVVKGARTT